MLYDALAAAELTKDDVDINFVKDLTGDDGPAEAFRKDDTIDACCVITPDMIGLTGGLDVSGTGAEGTVSGAHVLVSTQNMSRSIADVYAVRSDWYATNKDTVEKFVAGYLNAAEQVVKMRDEFEKAQKMSSQYRSLLSMSQQILGEEVLPTLEVDAHGLLLDCRFIRLPGQIAFFEQSGNLSGFERKMSDALDLATSWGYARTRSAASLLPGWITRRSLPWPASNTGYRRNLVKASTCSPATISTPGTIVSFTISFAPNQTTFSVDSYGAEFNRALQSASTFGGAAVVIRGHSDPTKTLVNLIKAGMKKGVITRTGQRGNYTYFLKTDRGSQRLDLSKTQTLVDLIQLGTFEGTQDSPLQTMQAALNLSQQRADAVKAAIVKYAEDRGINVSLGQLAPIGAGITEPVVSKPTKIEEARQNMRVEFRIVKVDPETLTAEDFDF